MPSRSFQETAGAMAKQSILFVCLGNICRSPLAEGVFRAVLIERGMADDFVIDSAGMGDWHLGQAPDPRAIAVARTNGLDISGQRARGLRQEDFRRFDLILGMDHKNIAELHEIAPDAFRDKIHLFLDAAGSGAKEVPDPYFGDAAGFDETYRLIRAASEGLAETLAPRSSI
jgi:protein-tyrosine phosphatase